MMVSLASLAYSDEAYPDSRSRPARRASGASGAAGALACRLAEAAALLEAQPDDAALLLDGLLAVIVDAWLRERRLVPGDAADALRLIERDEPLFGMRLRLALRAPDPGARLEHCAALLALLPAERGQPSPAAALRGR